MKKAIAVVCHGSRHETIGEQTIPTIKAYAHKIGAEFVLLNEPVFPNPKMDRFQIFKLLNRFNRVAMLSADMIIRPDCPDLFEMVPENELGMFNEGSWSNVSTEFKDTLLEHDIQVDPWKGQYYNLGVIVASRMHKFLFEVPDREVRNVEAFLTARVLAKQVKVHELKYTMNRMPYIDKITGEHRRGSHIVHYSTSSKVPTQMLVDLIKSDISDWATRKTYDYPLNILIKTSGGLGDEICAEPVVRYIVEQAYKGDNIVVSTWFPRIFEHLPVRIVDILEFKGDMDTPYYVMETLVPVDNLAWKYMSANLMNGTDFMSQTCLRRILPDIDKTIKMTIGFEDLESVFKAAGTTNLRDLTLVHPGLGWESKTFPKTWWDKVIKGLVDEGRPVAIIGKSISSDQGTVDVDIPEGVLDLRNLLTLGGLLAIISQAKVLVSNDSSPIHIAGAFDNHIVLIPTCKHPDHVLPMRKGIRYHKATSLCKKVLCDCINSNPTQIHGQTIDKVPGDILDYLPEPGEVISEVKRVFLIE